MKCDNCANYMEKLDTCKFCSYEKKDGCFDCELLKCVHTFNVNSVDECKRIDDLKKVIMKIKSNDLKNVLKYVNVRSMTDEDYQSYVRLMKYTYMVEKNE